LLLQRTCQAELSLSGRYLLAQAHAADEQWERVLDVLGRSDAEAPALLLAEEEESEGRGVEVIPNAASAVCVLRAKAHERLDNREDTIKAYTDALRHDPLCIEAFQSLTARCMLTPEQSTSVLRQTDAPPLFSLTSGRVYFALAFFRFMRITLLLHPQSRSFSTPWTGVLSILKPAQ
jgi:hypothetical protein